MTTTYLIQGARRIDPAAESETVGDLFIEDGRIAPVPAELPRDTLRVPAAGLTLVPGLIDLHVHLREPGHEAAETVESGSRAAARGGFTTIVAMPNTNPPLDTPEQVDGLKDRARRANLVHVLPAPCITRGRAGRDVADLPALAKAGAVAFTDDGCTVSDDAVMEAAMRGAARLGKPIMDHALDPRLAGHGVMHEGPRSRELGLAGIPSEAETVTVARDIALARATGGAIHIQHLSAAGSVELIRQARREGLRVSAELTPHHLTLTDAVVDAQRADAFKMNPPVRSEQDRAALEAGLIDGTIACLATDHAPHTAETKAKGFKGAPFGVLGLETALAITYRHLVVSGKMTRLEWLKRWTVAPAAILGLPPPSLAIGAPADLVLLDLDREWVVEARTFASKSRNTSFEGWRVTGRAVMTFCAGRIVHTLAARNIVLMGFMGTGKSTLGRQLAARLGMTFVDMDSLIEERAGKPIPRIFAEDGEPSFRARERELARELSARQGLVVACGGGVVLNPENVRDYAATGAVFCLTATPEVIFERTSKDRNRPLLEEQDRMKRIVELLEKRRALYAAIPEQVDTTTAEPDALVAHILARLEP